ncbi:MAG: prolyl oligopeptidase family serine peptidase [Roseiflexaceae bacterium]
MADSTLRNAILQRLGRFPERVPLAATFGSARDMGDHTRTLVSYAVEANERVDAWLLRPSGDQPARGWPAILALHQHAGQFYLGKAEPAGLSADRMYHYGLDLCRRGYLVLCPDHLCFEDRRPPEYMRIEKRALSDQGYERFAFTQRLLAGSCLQTKYLHDMVCALDLLAELSHVNAARLGAIGHSLGGQEALWLAWYDRRVRAAVSSCGFGRIDTIIRDAINHNYALYVPGLLELCDTDGLLAEIAPRAFLLSAGEQDALFPIDGVRALAASAEVAYAACGVPERFRAIIFPTGHSFPDQVKAEAYAFLDRWLHEEAVL